MLNFRTENEITGEALIALLHDDLKDVGILSVGHRLTVLKAVYELKIKQDVPIDSDHYVPQSRCNSPLPHWITRALQPDL